MGCINDYQWFFCQQKIPYFQYRIIGIIFFLALTGVTITLSPILAALTSFLDDLPHKCKFDKNLMSEKHCYLEGFRILIILAGGIMIVVGVLLICFKIRKTIQNDRCALSSEEICHLEVNESAELTEILINTPEKDTYSLKDKTIFSLSQPEVPTDRIHHIIASYNTNGLYPVYIGSVQPR